MKKIDLLIISITIFLTVIAWTVAEIIHTSSNKDNLTIKSFQHTKTVQLDKGIFDIIESKEP